MSGDQEEAAKPSTGAPQGMDSEWAVQQCNEWLRLHERVPIPEAARERHGPKGRYRGSLAERAKLALRLDVRPGRVELGRGCVWYLSARGGKGASTSV
jgi:hypothetical protein